MIKYFIFINYTRMPYNINNNTSMFTKQIITAANKINDKKINISSIKYFASHKYLT